jgi:hypothetical protein
VIRCAALSVAIGAQWAVNFTSPRRVSQRAGRVWRLDTYVPLVSILHVIGYVKESAQLEGVD